MFGLSPAGEEGEENETDSINIQDLVNNDKCHPNYPFNLCCHKQEAPIFEIFMGVEVSTFYNLCWRCMLPNRISSQTPSDSVQLIDASSCFLSGI